MQKLGIDSSHPIRLPMAALLVLDMQNEFLTDTGALPVWGGPAIIDNVNRLIEGFRTAANPVYFTRHFCIEPQRHSAAIGIMANAAPETTVLRRGTTGSELHPGIRPAPGEEIVEKYRYSAFFDTTLPTLLGVHARRSVVITGVATNICCETTAHDAFFRGFDVLFCSDATGGTDEEAHLATLRNIRLSYGQVVTTDQILHAISQGEG